MDYDSFVLLLMILFSLAFLGVVIFLVWMSNDPKKEQANKSTEETEENAVTNVCSSISRKNHFHLIE